MKALSIGVLVSGRGSNLEALLNAVKEHRLQSRVALVISNVANVRALEIAREHSVPALHLAHTAFADRASYDRAVVEALTGAGVSFVVLAGFMRIVTPVLLDAFADRVINIHPSLLPSFPGKDAAKQAITHGVKVSGATVHVVDAGMDTGPILAQAPVEVLLDDTEQSLAARILEKEHVLLVDVVRAFEEERVHLSNGTDGVRLARVVPGGSR